MRYAIVIEDECKTGTDMCESTRVDWTISLLTSGFDEPLIEPDAVDTLIRNHDKEIAYRMHTLS